MKSKFEKVVFIVKVHLLGCAAYEKRYEGEFRNNCWVFNTCLTPCYYSEETIEKHIDRFEVVRKPRKIKSVVMKESRLWKEKCNYWDYNGSFNEDYILNNPDKFIIEYED